MTTTAVRPRTPEDIVAPVAAAIREHADEQERARRMPESLHRMLREAGLFAIYVPPELGNGGLAVPEALRVVEEVARIDGSTGWTVALAFASDLFTGILGAEDAKRVIGSPAELTAGRGGQPGRADPVDGGYRVSGQWSYVSGCVNAGWLCLDAIVFENGQPRMQPHGLPEDILFWCPAASATVIETWDVSGLAGTGTHDVRLDGVFVPTSHTAAGLLAGGPGWRREGPVQRLPFMVALAIAQSPAVCLGIAQHAIEAFAALAEKKVHSASQRPLAERPAAQEALARAEAGVRSARLFFYGEVERAWATVTAGGKLEPRDHALLRLACVTAAESATVAVDRLWRMAGTAALFRSNELERCWRDVHAAAQHVQVQEGNWETCGRVLLGRDPGTFLF